MPDPSVRLRLPDGPVPAPGDRLELDGEEAQHARARRLAPGDGALGLDGAGHEVPLTVESLDRRGAVLRCTASARREPAPGEPGATLPSIELMISWPRRNRVEAMLSSLTQLGAATIVPLVTAHRGPEPPPARVPDRWTRVAFEALKQSGRLWLPRLEPAVTLEAALARPGTPLLLDPGAATSLPAAALAALESGGGRPDHPLQVWIGPEGGWSSGECDALAHARAARLGPHVLRIETAAVAAMAVLAATCG